MKKTLLLLSAFVASLVTFAQTNLTSGKVVHPLGGLKTYTKNDDVTKYSVINEDLQKITKDGNTANVYLFPEGGYKTDANEAIGIQGFYIDLGEAKEIGAIKSTWEGAAAGGNIYVTNNEPAADGTLTDKTLIGTFTNAQETKKDIAVSVANSGRYVVFVPTVATEYAWGVKICTFAAYLKETSVLTSLEVTPAMVKVNEATEMKFVAKDQLGIEITEGVSYTVSNNATLEGTTLTANNAGEITVTATCNGISVSKTIIATSVSAPTSNPDEPIESEENVLAVYSAVYEKGLNENNPGYGIGGGAPNPVYTSMEEVEIVDGHKVVHVLGTGFNNRTKGSVNVTNDYNSIHVAVYPFTATEAKIFGDNQYDKAVTITGLKPGEWNYIKVENTVNGPNYILIELVGESEFYLDHFYFSKEAIEGGSFTIAAACTDGEKYYGTFYTEKAYVMPEGVEGQIVSVADNKLVVETAYETGTTVPANTPLLMCSSKPAVYTYKVSTEEGTQPTGENMLHGGNTELEGNYLYYRLTMHEGNNIGFWWGAENGGKFNLDANKAYLAVPAQVAVNVRGFGFDGEATAISNVKAEAAGEDVIYDLSGRRVIAPVKAGIYIVNGKKMVIK